jgi:hypothetical protein
MDCTKFKEGQTHYTNSEGYRVEKLNKIVFVKKML